MNVQFEVHESVVLRRTYEAKITQAEILEAMMISRREFLEDPEEHVAEYIEGHIDELLERMRIVDTHPEEESERIDFDEVSDIEGLPESDC